MPVIDILMRRGQRFEILRRIEAMDPTNEDDLGEIVRLTAYYEFPFEYVQGTAIAFMRDYGVPTISDLLDRTGRFEHDGQKRYDDTNLFGYEAAVEGVDSARAHAAVRKLNGIHGAYGIPNHEFQYVLATTLVGPKRFIDAYGYRPLHQNELLAMTWFTTRFGRLMGIKDLPTTYEGYEQLLDTYEAEHFAYDPANTRVAEASIRIVTNWYPAVARPFVRRVLIAMLDEPLRVALGLPEQPRVFSRSLHALLVLRGRVMRRLPPRRDDDPYVHDASRTYPFGYTIADLGPAEHSVARHAHAGSASPAQNPA